MDNVQKTLLQIMVGHVAQMGKKQEASWHHERHGCSSESRPVIKMELRVIVDWILSGSGTMRDQRNYIYIDTWLVCPVFTRFISVNTSRISIELGTGSFH
jgi:hypothetical protein